MLSDSERSRVTHQSSFPSTLADTLSISSTHTSHDAHQDDGTRALTPSASRASNGPPLSRRATSIGTTGTSALEFEIDWEGDKDPENPRNWPTWYKAIVIGFISFSTWVVVLYSTSYTTGTAQMMQEFGIDSEPVVTLGVTVYLLGLALGGVVLAPLSEMYGRKPIYMICMFFFMVLIIPCGMATSLTEVLVVRFFGAIAGSSMIANAPGSISDIVTDDYRALAFSIWSIGPLNGPVFGPVIGGFITQYMGFRFTNWVVMMCSGVAWAFVIILKETYSPVILKKRAAARRASSEDPRWWCRYEQKMPFAKLMRVNLTRPFIMAATEPICIFWNVYIATIYGILYLCFVAYPIVFTEIRGWSTGISGLAFVGIGIGTLLIIAFEPLIRRMINSHKLDPTTGKVFPEATVSIVIIAAVLAPIGQLWFSWTCAPPTHWVWSILAGIPFGAGNTGVFIYSTSYMTGAYGIYTASALAGNSMARSLIGGTLPLAGPRMYQALGPHWAGTVLGLLQVVMIPIPVVFYKYGGKIREKSALIRHMRDDQAKLEGKRSKMDLKKAEEVVMEAGLAGAEDKEAELEVEVGERLEGLEVEQQRKAADTAEGVDEKEVKP